ncbi:MAG: FGGY family carbohydrate kinase [Anaerolineae bacterium]|nr:FGGY family carbohydrate kinase [Anaerolineae bacterium]
MSLLGIDVGTTGCKAAVFSRDGRLLATAYAEYDVQRPQPGWAELDAARVWEQVKGTIRRAVTAPDAGEVQALAVSSLGEAMVPVTEDRQVLGPSILNFDVRGAEYLPGLQSALGEERLYRISGNTLGNHFGLTKLMWVQEHQPRLYERAWKFLPWGCFVPFMLGADPVVDYSLANRILLFDLEAEAWSREILAASGLDEARLPATAPTGTLIGRVPARLAAELGLPPGVAIVAGAHDQCANAVGCGVIDEGHAMWGMGTYTCIVPVYRERREPQGMIARGLNTEHHAAPGRFVSFIYNQGGALVKWFRDTFAALEHRRSRQSGQDVYPELFAEMPSGPSGLVLLPHFAQTGPPHFIADSCGVIAGLHLDTPRGAILKAILEGTTFYLRECIESLPEAGIEVADYRAVGGGSKSEAWIQLCADVVGRPFTRPAITEAGALGAALIAGVGVGEFQSFEAGVEAMVRLERSFEPDPARQAAYDEWFARYRQLWPLAGDYLRGLAGAQGRA